MDTRWNAGADNEVYALAKDPNGAIFVDVPTAVFGAEFVTRTATPITLG